MRDKIEALIKNHATNLSLSTKDSLEQLLSQFEHQELFSTISDYMDSASVSRREWIMCAEILCRIDKHKANLTFVNALKNDDEDKRFRIVKLLWQGCGTEHIVPTLIEMLKEEPDPSIRLMVAMALGEIGDKRALPALEWSADNDHETNYEGTLISSEAKSAISNLLNDLE
jgi:HEAT repeat protein